jgi:hypothetical protein
MIAIKLNGKPYNFPTHLNEITLGQWLQLRASKNEIEDLSVLTGLSISEISGYKSVDDFKKCKALLQTLQTNFERDLKQSKIPKTVKLGSKFIEVPKKLELEPIGAYVSVYNTIAAEFNTYEANGNRFSDDRVIADILGYYFYLPYSGEGALYDDEKAESQEYVDLILQLPFLDAATIAMFFFAKFPNL